MNELLFELYKLALQFIFIVIAGGAISWLYSWHQQRKEQKMSLLRDFTTIHGKFISVRYRYNPSFVFWREHPDQTTHPLTQEELRLLRWQIFSETCELLAQFQSLKPLLLAHFKHTEQPLNALHQYYHDWRRRVIRNQPILQEKDGKNEPEYENVKELYQTLIKIMRKQI